MASRKDYPSYGKNYHTRPQLIVRLSDEAQAAWDETKSLLGSKKTHLDVLLWLLDKTEGDREVLRLQRESTKRLRTEESAVAVPPDVPGQAIPPEPNVKNPWPYAAAPFAELSDTEDDRFDWTTLDEDPDILDAVGPHVSADVVLKDHVQVVPSPPVQSSPVGPSKETCRRGFVERSKMEEFFKVFQVMCPRSGCYEVCACTISTFGMLYSVKSVCVNSHETSWLSGETSVDGGFPAVHQEIFHSSLCCGLGYTQLSEFFGVLGCNLPSKDTCHAVYNGTTRKSGLGTLAAIERVWQQELSARREALLGKPVALYLDARFDSTRDAYHGTVTFIEVVSGCILGMVTVKKTTVGNAWKIEDAAVRKGLEELVEDGVEISEGIHDDKRSVDTILAEYNIVSQKDLWHKAKGLSNKFRDQLMRLPKDALKSIEECQSRSDVASLTMTQMQSWLRTRGLSTRGKKIDLVEAVCRVVQFPDNLDDETEGADDEILVHNTRTLRFPELTQHALDYRFKSWFYVCCRARALAGDDDSELLARDVRNAALHWSGDHSACLLLDSSRKCVVENWGKERAYFLPESPTFDAVTDWLRKRITPSSMRFYTRARENFLSETVHSLMNKYAPKRIHYQKTHIARLACAGLDWNENRGRTLLKVLARNACTTAVRKRAAFRRVLTKKTYLWKGLVWQTYRSMSMQT
jgi:hypothetical protein